MRRAGSNGAHSPTRLAAEAALERARARGERFALLFVSGLGPGSDHRATDLLEGVEPALGAARTLSFPADGGFVLAVADFDSTERLEAGACALLERARGTGCGPLNVGLAHNCIPRGLRTDLTFETLLAVAREGEQVAAAGGGDRWCHSELYELCALQRDRAPADASAPEDVALHASAFSAPSAAAPEPELAEEAPRESAPAEPAPGEEKYLRRIDRLERLLRKMRGELARAEDALVRARLHGGTDPGVASWHREVQGLSPLAPDYEQKRFLLNAIFEANVAMRASIG